MKKYVDDSLGGDNVLGFDQTIENDLKFYVGNDVYNLSKYDKKQVTDTSIIIYPNNGGYLLQNWVIKCNDKNNNRKIQNSIKSTKTNSPTSYSGATSLPLIGNSFMNIEIKSNIHG